MNTINIKLIGITKTNSKRIYLKTVTIGVGNVEKVIKELTIQAQSDDCIVTYRE